MGKSSKEQVNRRQKNILCFMSNHPNITIDELAETAGTSCITIRRDINRMIADKMVVRSAAGRFSLLHDPAFDERYFRHYSSQHAQKVAIAQAAIGLVSDGSIIGVDSSSTCLEFGKLLLQKKDITLITNNLFLPQYLMRHTSLHLDCVGGQVNLKNNSTEGPAACAEIAKFNYDCVFFSAGALDFSCGLSNAEPEGIDTKLAFLRNAAKRILLLDSTKFGQKSYRNFLPLSEVSFVVTDDGILPGHLACLERLKIPSLIAPLP